MNKKPVSHDEPEQKKCTDNDDWKYKPILNTNTRCNYDGNEIKFEWMEE